MVKGKCEKLETLGDGSVKLSVYVSADQIGEAVRLAKQNVTLTLGDAAVSTDAPDMDTVRHVAEMALRGAIAQLYKGDEKVPAEEKQLELVA